MNNFGSNEAHEVLRSCLFTLNREKVKELEFI